MMKIYKFLIVIKIFYPLPHIKMFRNEKTPEQLFSYYEMLWFTKEQCQILSLFGFNDEELILAITLYNESSLKLKWISFVKSLSDFIDF